MARRSGRAPYERSLHVDLDDPVHGLVGQRNRQLAIDQVVVELLDEQRHDAPQVIVGQRLEHDDLVDAVDELRVEGSLHLAEDHVGHALVDGANI